MRIFPGLQMGTLGQLKRAVEWEPILEIDVSKKDPEEILLKAFDPDNLGQARQLVKLFRRCYQTRYPFSEVYSTNFWCSTELASSISTAQTNMVATSGTRIIAHIAYYQNLRNDAVELLFPAIDPAYRKEMFRLARAFWKRIDEQARKQGWRYIYQYMPATEPLLQLISARCFYSVETALIPAIIPSENIMTNGSGSTAISRPGLVVSYHVRSSAARFKKVYPPRRHADKIEEIYTALGLPREVVRRPEILGRKREEFLQNSLVAQSGGFQLETSPGKHRFQLKVLPSLTHSWEKTLNHLLHLSDSSSAQNRWCTVLVALGDPGTPEFIEALETLDYRFCGLLPMLGEHDYLAYGRFTDAALYDMHLYTRRAKALREYLLSHY